MYRAQNAQELLTLIGNKTVFHHISKKNADGTPQRWRLNGVIKLFKRNPQRIEIPLKRGLYDYGKISTVAEFYQYFVIPD